MALFPPSVVAAAAALGVDVSSLGQQEVQLLKQILAASTAIPGGGGAPSGPAGGVLGGSYPNPTFGFTGLTIGGGALTNISSIFPDAGTTNVASALTIGHSSSGVADVGFGSSINYQLQSNAGTPRIASKIITAWTTATDGSENSVMEFVLMNNGAESLSFASFDSTGSLSIGGGSMFKNLGTGQFSLAASGSDILFFGGTNLEVLAGVPFRVRSPNNANWMIMSHDGTNGILTPSTGAIAIASGSPFRLGATATTGLIAGALAALTTASITVQDSTGTTYRIPCVTP